MKNILNDEMCYELLVKVADILNKQNVTFWLDQGTLLGLIREGKFIEWDWDIDLSAFYYSKLSNISKVFKSQGFNVRYIKKSHSLRLEPKVKYYGWRHIDIHFHKLEGDFFITHFYDFKNESLAQSVVLAALTLFDSLERRLAAIAPSRRQVYFNSDIRDFKSIKSNRIQSLLAKCFNLIKNKIYSIRLMMFANYVEVTTPRRFFASFETVKFRNHLYRVPVGPEKYLEFKYGKDWKIPNHNYDWHNDGAVKLESEEFK